jgi:phytoene dehydrogenase-like protein
VTARYDAIVVGASVNGLAAAAYLAKAGKHVLVLDARNSLGGLCETAAFGSGFHAPFGAHTVYALDPRVVRELKLARHGLKFASRDMPLVGLRADGKHLVIGRDLRAAARSIAVHSRADAEAWPHFRNETYELARALRPGWWETGARSPSAADRVARLGRLGAGAWLDGRFESDALKAALAFDMSALSPLEPGAPLLALWRASQEMCGLQGAAAIPQGGPAGLATAMTAAAKAAGVEFRTGARVDDYLVDNAAVAGVVLSGGETIAATLVLSCLSRRRTLLAKACRSSLGLAEATALFAAKPKVAAAKVMLALDTMPVFGGVAVPPEGRFIIADRIETFVAAHAAARAGRLPDELPIEAVLPSAADPGLAPPGQHLVSVLVRPVPAAVEGGWEAMKPQLAAKVVMTLGRHVSGIERHVKAAEVLTPDDFTTRYGVDDEFGGQVSVDRILGDWRARICTPIAGLYLCGAAAEPVGAVSARAGRIAAMLALGKEVRT